MLVAFTTSLSARPSAQVYDNNLAAIGGGGIPAGAITDDQGNAILDDQGNYIYVD
jgi:hypothetical protein